MYFPLTTTWQPTPEVPVVELLGDSGKV